MSLVWPSFEIYTTDARNIHHISLRYDGGVGSGTRLPNDLWLLLECRICLEVDMQIYHLPSSLPPLPSISLSQSYRGSLPISIRSVYNPPTSDVQQSSEIFIMLPYISLNLLGVYSVTWTGKSKRLELMLQSCSVAFCLRFLKIKMEVLLSHRQMSLLFCSQRVSAKVGLHQRFLRNVWRQIVPQLN
jgi:hypothetical protein